MAKQATSEWRKINTALALREGGGGGFPSGGFAGKPSPSVPTACRKSDIFVNELLNKKTNTRFFGAGRVFPFLVN